MRSSSSDRRSRHNAPMSEGLISDITITEPGHALHGRSFPLLSLRAERGRDYLVFGLPDGRRRTVRKSSTNLDAVAREDHALKEFGLPQVSVRTLVPLARHLRTKFASATAEVIRDARPSTSCPPACVAFEKSSTSPGEGSAALAQPADPSPDAIGQANRPVAVSHDGGASC